MRTKLLAAAAISTASLVAMGGLASAQPARSSLPREASAAAGAVDSTTTLPLFGAPLTIELTAAPGGALASVSLNPADGMTATKVKPNKVQFVNEDGTIKIQVRAKHGGQSVVAKAGQLADVLGPGSWAGDIFGTGIKTVTFTTADKGDGTPDITGVSSDDPSAVVNATEYKTGHDADFSAAVASVVFTNATQSRTLWITVSVGTHDGETRAKLAVTLSGQHGVRLPAANVVGAQSWSGVLCDGSPASIMFNVADDGTITDVAPNPTTATVEGAGTSRVGVAFSDHERVRIRVKSNDGEMKLSFSEKIRCEQVDPTVNTPIDESADNGQPGDGQWHDGHNGHNSDDRGGHDANDDHGTGADGHKDDGHSNDG